MCFFLQFCIFHFSKQIIGFGVGVRFTINYYLEYSTIKNVEAFLSPILDKRKNFEPDLFVKNGNFSPTLFIHLFGKPISSFAFFLFVPSITDGRLFVMLIIS